jgi:hypothetical protein
LFLDAGSNTSGLDTDSILTRSISLKEMFSSEQLTGDGQSYGILYLAF